MVVIEISIINDTVCIIEKNQYLGVDFLLPFSSRRLVYV